MNDEAMIAEYRDLIREYYSMSSNKEAEEIISRLQWIAGHLGWAHEYALIDEGYWQNGMTVEELIPQLQR